MKRGGEVGAGPQAKYTGLAQVNNTREKPPEIYCVFLKTAMIENDFIEMNALYPRTAGVL